MDFRYGVACDHCLCCAGMCGSRPGVQAGGPHDTLLTKEGIAGYAGGEPSVPGHSYASPRIVKFVNK